MTELGLDGVQIGTHVGDRNLDDPAIEAVLAAADGLGAAVFVHPWDMLAPERMTRHWLPWLVGMPSELALAIASVVLGGVLDRQPDLRLLFAHGGGAFPSLLGRVEAGFHARPDLAATATDTEPRDAVRRIYMDSLTHDPDALRFIAGIVGEDRIALGTDYPFPLGEAVPGATIEALTELSPEARTRMLAGTAEAFLGRALPEAGSGAAAGATAVSPASVPLA